MEIDKLLQHPNVHEMMYDDTEYTKLTFRECMVLLEAADKYVQYCLTRLMQTKATDNDQNVIDVFTDQIDGCKQVRKKLIAAADKLFEKMSKITGFNKDDPNLLDWAREEKDKVFGDS